MSDIPHDEKHEFLYAQRTRERCLEWSSWLTRVGAPHDLAQRDDGKWTIYKHRCIGRPHNGVPADFCCGASA